MDKDADTAPDSAPELPDDSEEVTLPEDGPDLPADLPADSEEMPEIVQENMPADGEEIESAQEEASETMPEPAPAESGPVTEAPAEPAEPAMEQPSGGESAPDAVDTLAQVADAFQRLLDVLPGWFLIALVVVLAVLVVAVMLGVIIGMRVSRGASAPAPPEAPRDDTPTVRAALPPSENPAFKKYQAFLEEKGVAAKEMDSQMRAFAGQFKDMRQNLRDLMPGNTDMADAVERVRDALDAGDFQHMLALLETIGERENTDGVDKRTQSLKHLMAGAVARSIAGDLQMVRMEPKEAAEHFRLAVEALPPFQEDLHAELLNKYGTASYQSGEPETAIAAFERALSILERRLGKNHPDVATALNNLALIHYSRGNYDGAEPLYRRPLMIDEQTLGIDHPGVATDLNNLALLYKKQGDLESAEPLLKRAMEIKEKHFDPGHPSLVTGQQNYAALLRALGRDEEAEVFERRATVLPPKRTEEAAE